MCGGVILDQGVGWVGVIGVAELLSKTTLTEEQREYLNIIRVSGDSLLRIISDILDLSKIETHKLVLERAQFGVRELLTESLSLFQVIAQEKGIKVLDRPHLVNHNSCVDKNRCTEDCDFIHSSFVVCIITHVDEKRPSFALV